MQDSFNQDPGRIPLGQLTLNLVTTHQKVGSLLARSGELLRNVDLKVKLKDTHSHLL